MELKILQIQLYTWLSRCQDRHNKSKSLCHKMHEDQGYTHLSLGVQDNSLHTPVYGKHPQVILPLILPIEQKQGVVVWQFLIKRMTRPAGPSNWKCGVPLTLLNFWGPSSFIFYWVIPAYKWSPRLQPPVVTPPPLPHWICCHDRRLFHLFKEVAGISPKRELQKDGPYRKANILVLLFGV